MNIQNKSHAVMAQRYESNSSLDNFPTPPWATRALVEQYLDKQTLSTQTCLEPACGAGHMAKVLKEYFDSVDSSDIYNYGYGEVRDFTKAAPDTPNYDWVITNPPFRLAESFINQALKIASSGVAILARTVFIESIGRYDRLFSKTPPTQIAQFCERVPMVKGRLDAKATTATGYAWLIWDINQRNKPSGTSLCWIKACRKTLEYEGDYAEIIGSETR